MTRISSYLRDETGTSAVEFALVLIPFLVVFFGLLHLSLLMYSANRLSFATEATARCLAVSAASKYSGATCSDTTKAATYFSALYGGPAPATPTFPTDTCGARVDSTASYSFNALFASRVISLSASACFPET